MLTLIFPKSFIFKCFLFPPTYRSRCRQPCRARPCPSQLKTSSTWSYRTSSSSSSRRPPLPPPPPPEARLSPSTNTLTWPSNSSTTSTWSVCPAVSSVCLVSPQSTRSVHSSVWSWTSRKLTFEYQKNAKTWRQVFGNILKFKCQFSGGSAWYHGQLAVNIFGFVLFLK